MAQEFLIRLWCDRHALTERKVEATTSVPLSLPGYPNRVIDLCAECNVRVEELLEVVAKNGRPAEGATTKRPSKPLTSAGPVQPALDDGVGCPACSEWFNRNEAMTQHFRNTHRDQYGSIQELFGRLCPICGLNDLGNLGVHANRGHGVSGAANAFAVAEREGDPHGAVAALRRRVDALRLKPAG